MLNLYRKKQSKILESKQMLLVKRFITQHFRQELYSVLNNRNVIRRRLRLTHQWHSRSICKLHIGYSFGSSGVAIWYNSNICNLKKRVSWQTDQTKNEQNRGKGIFQQELEERWLTCPTFEKNSSKSLGLIFLASCIQNAVLASLSSGVISSAGFSSLLHKRAKHDRVRQGSQVH